MAEAKSTDDAFIAGEVARGRAYVIGFYKAAANAPKLAAEDAQRLQMEHLRFLFKLRSQGTLALNGPLTDAGPVRGIGIFDDQDVDRIAAIMADDPAVLAGVLEPEVHPWFGLPGDTLPG